MKYFKQRVDEFWSWFDKNEEKIEHYIANITNENAEEVISFMASGLEIAICGCLFELGGKNEINLSSNGNAPVMMLQSYLASSIPEKYKNNWEITPWKKAVPNAELRMGNVSVSAKNVFISAEHDDNGKFRLNFYSDIFRGMEENQIYNVFVMILDCVLGENISLGFVSDFEYVEEKEAGMFALAELYEYMKTTLQSMEKEMPEDFNPCQMYSGYSMTPYDSDEPRTDIIAGFSTMTILLNEYYEEETEAFETLYSNGAKAAFIEIERTNEDYNIDLDIRNNISDRIENEIFGEPSSGNEFGAIIGQAIGEKSCYIDILMYDEKHFRDNISNILKDYELNCRIYDLKAGSEPQKI